MNLCACTRQLKVTIDFLSPFSLYGTCKVHTASTCTCKNRMSSKRADEVKMSPLEEEEERRLEMVIMVLPLRMEEEEELKRGHSWRNGNLMVYRGEGKIQRETK